MPDVEEVMRSFPHDPIDQDNVEFYAGLLECRLMVNRCDSCGTWHHPPQPGCPQCWSLDLVARRVGGNGVVHLLSLLAHPPPGRTGPRPYPIAVVALAEQADLHICAPLIGFEPDEMTIGMPVRLTWIDTAGPPLPAFGPVEPREED